LVAGAGGTANEILTSGKLESNWDFLAVDPSDPMLALAMGRVAEAGLAGRTKAVLGEVRDLPLRRAFDAATLIGVLHHIPDENTKLAVLKDIAQRLKPQAPLILAGNCRSYNSDPLFMAAWGRRWQMHGADEKEVKTKLDKILQGAEPPKSEEVVAKLLHSAGFTPPVASSRVYSGEHGLHI
jgi:tRNA (cmo5U34)-methyltransferase